MAITTLDGLVAGFKQPKFFYKGLSGTLVAGRPFSPFYTAGIPGAAAAPTPGLAGAALTSYAGQIPFDNPVSGNSYLARFAGAVSQPGILMLCDRLWHNSGFTITSTTGQTVNSAAWPARDQDGSTNGVGVVLGVEISSATGAGTPTITVDYTNSSGTAGKTGSNIIATASSSAIGTFYPIGLAAGDVGVRSVQTLTLSATWTSGTMHLVAYRVLATMPVAASVGPGVVSPVVGGLPRLYDNTVPFLLFVPSTTTSAAMFGTVSVAQG